MKATLLLLALLLVGCHGSEFRLGGGNLFHDSGGSISARNCGNSATGAWESDDTQMLYAELAFQLTPQTVVLETPAPTITSSERFYPFDDPDDLEISRLDSLFATVTELKASLAKSVASLNTSINSARADQAEELAKLKEEQETLKQDAKESRDMLMGLLKTGGGLGGLGLLGWGGNAYYQRRRRRGGS